jgi:hypothetical protein
VTGAVDKPDQLAGFVEDGDSIILTALSPPVLVLEGHVAQREFLAAVAAESTLSHPHEEHP